MRFFKLIIIYLLCHLIACNKSSPTNPQEEYINNKDEYSGNIIVSTPEAFELFNIAASLTGYGLQDNYYISKNSRYYEEVQSFFAPKKSHTLVELIEKFCDQGSDYDILLNYINIQKASLYLQLEGDTLTVNNDLYNFVPDSIKYMFQQILVNANSFLKESDFIRFYKEHLNVYQDIAEKFKAAIPSQTVWNWLETQFKTIQYQYYIIPLSPLTGGTHSTELDKLTGNKIYMIVTGPTQYLHNKVDEGSYTLFLFTEIDHNYVNPVSDIHLDEINIAFADIDKWNNQIGYRTPYDTFNEYMTWAIFTLFAYDRYSETEFQEINASTVNNMISNRKFIKFNEFNEELLRLYKNKENYNSIEELFTLILDWAKKQ